MATSTRDSSTIWAAVESWDCSTCGQPMPFETLPCVDGHGDDCPDRICTGCGAVLVMYVAVVPERRSA